MKIVNCTMNDVDQIMFLYEEARKLQTQKGMVVWPVFERSLVEREIDEQRQWKLVENDVLLCNWAVTYRDKEIWGEQDQNNAIYIHRIATHPDHRGKRHVDAIVSWSKIFAGQMGKEFVRMDTLGNNTGLIRHYESAGFSFLGIFKLPDTSNLPGHYQKEPNCCLFEMSVQ